jgi:acetyl esterase/lipase
LPKRCIETNDDPPVGAQGHRSDDQDVAICWGVALLTAVHTSIWAFVLAAMAGPGLAQVAAPKVEVQAVHVDTYPRLEATFPGGVRGLPSVTYWTPSGFRPLTLDLYLPPAAVPRPTTGLPLVIYIHGGGWLNGDSRKAVPFVDFPGVLASLASRGYAVASVNYRLSGEARFPAQIQDVKASIRFLRLHADEYGIDPGRAIAWGVSAGGHLAAMAAVSCGALKLAPRQPGAASTPDVKPEEIVAAKVSDCVQGAVAWYGVFDMATIADQARADGAMSREVAGTPEWRLLGCFKTGCAKGQMRLASPVSYIRADTAPMLLIVGDADTLVPYHQTLELAARLEAAGARRQVTVIAGVNHSLIGDTPEATREANLKALTETFSFIDRTIGPGAR